MSESKKVVAKRRPTKGEDKIRKIQMFKETANNAISDATEFDKAILESNEVYVNKLCEADNAEYEIKYARVKFGNKKYVVSLRDGGITKQ